MFLTLSGLKKQELLKEFLCLINPRWIGVVLLQIFVGLSCIFVPWYLILIIFTSFVLIIFFHLRLKMWTYILVFLLPFIGVKYPTVYLHIRGFSAGMALPVLPVISVFASLSLILLTLAKLREDDTINPLFVPILLLVCYGLLTIFWTPASVGYNLNYFIYLILDISLYYFLFHIIDNIDFHRRLMWCVVFAGFFLSIQALLSFVNTIIYKPILVTDNVIKIFNWFYMDYVAKFSDKELTVHGFFIGAQETGMVLDFTLFTALGLLLTEEKRLRKWCLRIMIPIIIVSVFFTGTKSGTWTLVVAIYIFLFLSRKFKRNIVRNSLLFFFIFLFIFLSTGFIKRHGGQNRLTKISTEQNSSLGKRIRYWKIGFKELDKRGLTFFGLGIGGYKYCTASKMIAHAHNVYLSMLFDFGFMGIIIFGLIILILAKMFFKLLRHQETYIQNMSFAFGINLIVIGTIGLVYIPYYMDFLWFVLALACSTFRLAQRESLDKVNNIASNDS